MLRNVLALRQIAQRTISTTSRRHFENKVPEKQKLFQEDNGMPVHLKGGTSDALLYRATMLLTVGGKTSFECLQVRSSCVGFLAFDVVCLLQSVCTSSPCPSDEHSGGQLEHTKHLAIKAGLTRQVCG
ncbi:cytochrome c oxidase subunit 7A2, mitochondrial isoform X1 [Rattus norvegicus]|uniref:cytochrome c oxidase subunit 7A2, mitochondrial isoform X1 n=1 Tax=Rattus norvegicus TaxID=10116 RepID=UPI002644D4F4